MAARNVKSRFCKECHAFLAAGISTLWLLLPLCTTKGQDDTVPAPAALLLGVENARLAYSRVLVRMEVFWNTGRPDAQSYRCLVEQVGQHRRFGIDVLNGRPQIIIQNGDECFGYRRTANGAVRLYDLHYGAKSGDLAYDPRLLGLAEVLKCNLRVDQCLWYDDADSLTTQGTEELDGIPMWRVVAVRDDTTLTDWIEEPTFRIHRRVVKTPLSVTTILSSYDGVDDGSPFPSHVEARYELNDGHALRTTITRVNEFALDASIPEDRFTLASMDLPLNTSIVDYRIQRVVGFWDGEGISPERARYAGARSGNLPPAFEEAKAQNTPSRYVWIAVVNVVFVMIVGGVWWRKRRAAG